jgi:hypothetical protein
MKNYEIEHVSEYVKAWTFIGRKPVSYDQCYIFGKQLHKEDIALRDNDRSIIVTECPLFLSVCYAKKYKAPGCDQLINLCNDVERTYPSLNFFIDRKSMPYKTRGRFQKYKAAVEMDRIIKQMMDDYDIKYEVIGFDETRHLLRFCVNAIGQPV